MPKEPPLFTPDGRYLVVHGRLWRAAHPHLPDAERQHYVNQLMHARRAVGVALRNQDAPALKAARAQVQFLNKDCAATLPPRQPPGIQITL